MVEEFEALIVKVGRVMPPGVPKINYKILNEWKNYTLQYFKSSPNVYFIENEFFNNLSEKIKTKLILENFSVKSGNKSNEENLEALVMPNFVQNFDYLFEDKAYRFEGDKKLKVMILSALTLEFVRSKDSLISNNVSSKIYFIDQGKVNVYYRD